MAKAKYIPMEALREQLIIQNLRGCKNRNIGKWVDSIEGRLADQDIGLIFIDPIYKFYGGSTDENSATQIALFLNEFERLAEITGAAVGYCHHFSKGDKSKTDSLDRGSGSGVFGRDPDAVITLTHHKEKNALVVEYNLRELPPVESHCILFENYEFKEALELNPMDLETNNNETYTDAEILACLEDGFTNSEWNKNAQEKIDISDTTFRRRSNKLIRAGRVIERDGKCYRPNVPTTPPSLYKGGGGVKEHSRGKIPKPWS